MDSVLAEIDDFIATQVVPLETAGDNARFLDHRRELARIDVARDGRAGARARL
jgi:acyl-CoA dehydrogenase